MRENLLIDKSIVFAARIIKLHKHLIRTQKETVISKQIVRSGTSIGANNLLTPTSCVSKVLQKHMKKHLLRQVLFFNEINPLRDL